MSVCRRCTFLAGLFALLVQGCGTTHEEPDVAVIVERPEQMAHLKRQIGDNNGLPVYALAGTGLASPRLQNLSFNATPATQLYPGRFSFPDFEDEVLSGRIQGALQRTFGKWVSFHGRGALSYTYEVQIPLSPGTKEDIVRVIRTVAADYSHATPGPDGKWQPDYARIASTTELRGMAASPDKSRALMATREGRTQRARVQSIVSFVQSIPYGLPPNGFLFPDEVLTFNYGDCDSKSVLAAVLMREVDPSLEYIFVDLPSAEHLVIGVGIDPLPGETTIKVGGRSYVLVEISGPAMAPLGMLSRSSRTALHEASSHIILSSGRHLEL